MNKTVKEKAYAKLNISLDVSRARDDGFHDMVMVMQSVSLCDDVTITLNDSGRISASSNMYYIPGDERNLAVKAARIFFETAGIINAGAEIYLEKRIPVGAGMAGGSSDAAAVLRALNAAYGDILPTETLLAVAEKTGSDVPFCLVGGTALATGRGEKLARLPDLPECTFAICKPEFSISTPELFRAIDRVKLRTHPDTAGIVSALEQGELMQVCRRMYNVFETVPDRRMKVTAEIKQRLIDGGAEGAIMTGTGSAVFGVFTDASAAESICTQFAESGMFACCAVPVSPQLAIPETK